MLQSPKINTKKDHNFSSMKKKLSSTTSTNSTTTIQTLLNYDDCILSNCNVIFTINPSLLLYDNSINTVSVNMYTICHGPKFANQLIFANLGNKEGSLRNLVIRFVISLFLLCIPSCVY